MNEAFAQFCSEVQSGEQAISLDRAALLVARTAYPELQLEEYLERLDELAALADQRGSADVLELARFLFRDQGFRGNREDYYDPRNSFLNDVLDRRVGLPITLSILYMEVGRRLGHRIEGLPLPGHFLVRVQAGPRAQVLDPFDGGREVIGEDLAMRTSLALKAEEISCASKMQILTRLSNNLKMIYLKADKPLEALEIVEHLMVLNPDDATELRDRGILYARLDCYKEAVRDLKAYLERGPVAADGPTVREAIVSLEGKVSDVH
jgi:regulator of sirC expression with transglutaminase-like and TPR domain